jgi:uncharacterized membrane protein
MRVVLFLIVFLAAIPIVFSAMLEGTIYDLSLDKVENVVVSIDTLPFQRVVSKNGEFSFKVSSGRYNLTAETKTAHVSELVIVGDDGEYKIDLILFPYVLEGDFSDEIESVPRDILKPGISRTVKGVLLIAALILVVVLYSLLKRKPRQDTKALVEDTFLNRILLYIKENRRVTQKEIVKKFDVSDAKISLAITELEHKGLITKIKKGRGNVIVLK